MFDAAIDGLIVTDQGGTILALNPAAERIFGCEAASLIGENVRTLMPSPYREEHDTYIADYLATGDRKVIGIGREVQGLRSNGTVFPMFLGVNEATIKDERFFVGVVHDLTDRVASIEMRLAKEAAEQSSAAKSEFLSRMSHELRTPLNAVIGFAQLMNLRADDHRVHQAAQSILTAGKHLLNLINEVLDLSRIEAGQLGLSLEPVSVTTLLTQSVELLKQQAIRRGVHVRIDIASDQEVFVQADKQRLLQVFINLLSNSLKYNRDGGWVRISVEARQAGLCVVSFTDSGVGIAGRDILKLFHPFERLGATDQEGTGLGLALSRRFMEAMGGNLELKSSSPEGSTFLIALQATEPPHIPGSGEFRIIDAERGELPQGTILCIEDNLSNLKLLEMALDPWPNVHIVPAMQGNVGLDLAKTNRPDLILLDLHLPDVPGETILNRIRSDPAFEAVPVVIVSADATDSTKRRLMQLGANDYLTKPIDIRNFLSLVEALMPQSSNEVPDA